MLMFFNVDYPILWSVIAMLFNFIPVVGSIIASIPAILLALINLDIFSAVWVIVLYMVINISISNIFLLDILGKCS